VTQAATRGVRSALRDPENFCRDFATGPDRPRIGVDGDSRRIPTHRMKTTFHSRICKSVRVLAALASFAFGGAEAAAYLKFDGVDGESTQKDHKNWINVSSMNMGGHRAGGSATTAARVTFKEFTVTKKTDRSSPKLLEAVCKGKVFPAVQLHLTEEGTDGEPVYYVVEMKNVLVTSYSLGGHTGSAPTEELSLNFEEIKITYVDHDGSKGGNVEFEWKVEEGES
jgi:type VI secretion system secreted protein Hcp